MDRRVTLTRGKVTKSSLRQAHYVAKGKVNTTITIFNEDSHSSTQIMPSFKSQSKTYQVKLLERTNNYKCNISGIYCEACLHQVKCSCPEYSGGKLQTHSFDLFQISKNGEKMTVMQKEDKQPTKKHSITYRKMNLLAQKEIIEKKLKQNNCSSEDGVQICILAFLGKLPSYNIIVKK